MKTKKGVQNMAELTYRKMGDYLIPNLVIEEEDTEEMPLGRYGMLRQTFLKNEHPGTYTSMLLTGRLIPHLKQIDDQAQKQVDQIVAAMMEQNSVDENLKERDQMAWVQAVNRFIAQAEEVVLKEIVYR